MSEFLSHLLERLPHFKERIESLPETNPALDEVAHEHHRVCDALATGRIDEPGERARLARRRVELEEELVRMLDASSRV